MDPAGKKIQKCLVLLLSLSCLVVSLFHIYVAWDSSISVAQQRVLHVFLMLFLYFLSQTVQYMEKDKRWSAAAHLIFTVVIIVVGIYFVRNTTLAALAKRGISGADKTDIVMGCIMVAAILFIACRTVGWALTVLSVIFIAYALLGPYMPDLIAHKGYRIPYIISYVAWTTESVFGSCIGACVSFVALYIVFGELLDKFGAGQFFIDIAYALTGRMKGGPAEASVVSSALMGSINGSAVANVVTTGTFTIPLMKKVGYKPEFAGAVEAVASTGGQLLPPVMGAAAFVMADMTGIPYSQIIIAAIIPGVLYYISLGVSVYLEADKGNMTAEDSSRLPQVKRVLQGGWYYAIPIIVLIAALMGFGLSANYSAIFAILSLLVIGIGKCLLREKRFPLRELYNALVSAAKTTIPVSIACACAGIVIGIVSMTGIGVKFTSIVFRVSGGNLFFMLLMIMLACIVMGMGLPSTAAYIIAASIGAPALVEAGIPLIAAHLFVFYFAIMSFITPPVAMSAYAASGIAGSSSAKTGWLAFMLGLPGFIIPFIYVYRPALLIIDTPVLDTVVVAVFTTLSVVVISVAVIGWFKRKLTLAERAVLAAAAVLMAMPDLVFNLAGAAAAGIVAGYIIFKSKNTVSS